MFRFPPTDSLSFTVSLLPLAPFVFPSNSVLQQKFSLRQSKSSELDENFARCHPRKLPLNSYIICNLTIARISLSRHSSKVRGFERKLRTTNLLSSNRLSFLFLSLQHIQFSAMSPFNVPESDKITLVTSDEPPQRYIVSRSRLSILSGVFRDLLSIPATVEDKEKGEIPLTEKAEELKGFIAIIREDDEELEKMYPEDWSGLAVVADKYNCRTATREVVSHTW